MKKIFSIEKLFGITIIFIGLCYLLYQFCFMSLGDDLTFIRRYVELEEERGMLAYPTFFYRHWLWSNARFADKINPLFFVILPKWVMYVANSVMLVSLFWLTAKLSRLKSDNILSKMALLTLMVFTLPWWDSLMLNVCWLNYVWSAALGLCVVYLFRKSEELTVTNRWLLTLMSLFSMFAIGMHEASGMPIFAGMITYTMLYGWKNLSTKQKVLLISVAIGAIYVASSPASWNRASAVAEMSNKRGGIEILLTSNLYLLVLSAIVIAMSFRKRGRQILFELIHSEWVIFIVAAIVSTGLSVMSGIIGRTGFFSQIYSLIAIFYCIARCKCDTAKVVKYLGSIILAAIIVVHYTFVVYYQKIAGDELNAMLEQYNNSEDGLVYMDYLREQQIPFWLLNKVKGVPDADDVWILHTISLYYSDLKKPLIILPEQLKSMDTSEIDGLQKLGLDYVSSEKPKTTDFMTYEGISLQHFYGDINGSAINYYNGGTEYIVTPFVKDNKMLYLISERYIDWGD